MTFYIHAQWDRWQRALRAIASYLGLSLLGILIGLYLYFGTLSPCSALKAELRAAVQAHLVAEPPATGAALVGRSLALALAAPLLDGLVEQQSPGQCVQALYTLHTKGLP